MAKASSIRQDRSDKKNTVALKLKFTKSTDQDIIDKLEEIGTGNKQAYIKQLIRNDLRNSNN